MPIDANSDKRRKYRKIEKLKIKTNAAAAEYDGEDDIDVEDRRS